MFKVKSTNSPAFTIVELLIVIVIIGVLATIAVVAFRGVQEKARTAAVLTTVESWQRYIAAQKVVGGKVKENVTSCLGKASDFPAADGFAEGECMQIYNNGNKTSSYVYRADDFSGFTNDAIPSSSHPITTYRSGNRMYKARGLVIANFATPFILYVPQLNGECGKGSRFEAENPQSSDLDGSLCGTLAI